MKGSDVFHLNIFKERFQRIMKQDPNDRKIQAETLMKDMEEVFEIPYSVDPVWEKKYPEVIELYERVNMEAV